MTTKRILFLTPQLPYPPHQGSSLRNFGIISGLAKRGHVITLLSLIDAGQPAPEDTPLIDICESLQTIPSPKRQITGRLFDLIRGYADMERRLWSPEFDAALNNLLNQSTFDAIHIEGLEMIPYLDTLVKSKNKDTILVYDAYNAEYVLQQRIAAQDLRQPRRWPFALYSYIQAHRLEKLETRAGNSVDRLFVVSNTDAEHLRKLHTKAQITVINNAILTDTYLNTSFEPADIPRPSLLFTGSMSFRPNVDAVLWFAEEVMPLIQRAMPEIHFTIVGKNPHPRLNALRERPDITLTDFVPNVRPYIFATDVYVAPLLAGGGTRFKLLEAMASKRAIVSTSMGAEGLKIETGNQMILADTPQNFSEAVLMLLQYPESRVEMGQRAADHVRKHFDWEAIIPRIEAAYP